MRSKLQTLLTVQKKSRNITKDILLFVLSISVGILIQYFLNSITQRPFLFVIYPVAIFVAWQIGLLWAVFSIVIMLLGSNYFFHELHSQVGMDVLQDIFTVGSFLIFSIGGAWLASEVSKKNALTSLAQNELETTLQSIGDGVLVIDSNRNVAFLNPIAEKMTGWKKEEARGQPMNKVFNIINEETRKPAFNPVDKVIKEGVIVGLANHTVLISKNGTEYQIEDSAAPIRNTIDGEKILGVILVFRDVTEKYALEKKSRENLWRLEATFNQLSEGFVFTDGQGGNFQMNQEALKIHGFKDVSEMLSDFAEYPKLFMLSSLDGRLLDISEWPLSRVLRGEKFSGYEVILARNDNEYQFVGSYSGTPVIDEETGKVGLAVLSIRDITQQKKNEKELIRSKEQAEVANHLKTSFLANMSHEIRTPMTAVLGFTEILRDPNISESERQDAFERIDRSGHALLRLIDDILDISKVESGKIEIQKSQFSPAELTSEVISAIKIHSEKKLVQIRMHVDPKVPKIAYSDPARIRQILTNLIGNALKFTYSGFVDIQLSVDQNDLIFEIIDTGIGISDGDHEKLFQPFAQADNSITRQFGGTGLGLALSRRLAENLKGSLVLASSKKNIGSQFIARIPGAPFSDQLAEMTLEQKKDLNHENKKTERPDMSTVTVLIAEDLADNQVLLKLYLESAGIKQIDFAENGEQALAKAMKKNYDLILMDIQMPVLDGIQATQRLRQNHYTGPIIALTAHAMREDIQRSIDAGCDAHLTKPITKEVLLDALKKHISHKIV